MLRESALQPSSGFRVANWEIYVINETFAPENKHWEGVRIADIAKERGVDVVVTATHGRSELADLIMGSTAEKLIRHAPCPVFVVRPGAA